MDNYFNPLVCGGRQKGLNNAISSCHTYNLGLNKWIESPALIEPRSGAAFAAVSAPSNLGILVAGGVDGTLRYLCSTESLNRKTNVWSNFSDTTSLLAPLPVCICYACMVQLSPTQVILTGGYDASGSSSRTYFYNPETNMWTNGPNMLYLRTEHACSTILDSNNMSTVIVVGG